ncbi:MAG TPA: ABC transporter permease [bacterium]|nr:ABC transporter permease [bacterium]
MGGYIARRALVSIPLLLLIVTVVFFAFRAIPGDPARLYVGTDASQETVEQYRRAWGLDQPVAVQYARYLSRLLRGDLGVSIQSGQTVLHELGGHFPSTLALSCAAMAVAAAVGIPLGILAGWKRDTMWDAAASGVALAGISIPLFWLGLLLIYTFSVRLHVVPSGGNETWRSYILPAVSLAMFPLTFIVRMTRSSLLDVIKEDYVRTARAKGLREVVVIGWHAVRNALLPVVTVIGLLFGYMLGGAIVTETIFAWPGLGRLLVTAVAQRDFPLIQGDLLLFAALFMLVNLAVDLLYAWIDPRIRLE